MRKPAGYQKTLCQKIHKELFFLRKKFIRNFQGLGYDHLFFFKKKVLIENNNEIAYIELKSADNFVTKLLQV